MTPPVGLISPFGLDWGAHCGRPAGCHPSHPPSLTLSRRGVGLVLGEQERGLQRCLLETTLDMKNHSNPRRAVRGSLTL